MRRWLGIVFLCACGDSDGTHTKGPDGPDGADGSDGAGDVAVDSGDAAPDSDDVAPDSGDTAPDSSDAAPDSDDAAPDSDDTAVDSDDTAVDTGYPEVTYAETLLEPDPAFDEAYEGQGDAVVSTLVEVLRPRYGFIELLSAAGELLAPVEELGHLEPQPGEPHRLRDQLALAAPVDWTPGALPQGARSILFGLQLSDPQLVDQDSPAQVAKNASRTLAGFSLPAYTPQGELAVHVDDALIRTADAFQDARPFDLVLITGDHIENSQTNELRQLHTLLNGGEVSSDSGVADDPRPGPDNDAFDPFVAGGFRAGTPWISSIGNHDVNIEGNFPPGLVDELTDDAALRTQLDTLAEPLGLAFPFSPTHDESAAVFPFARRSAFRVEPDDFNPAMMTSDAELEALTRGPIPADPERAALGVCGFIAKTRAAAGDPPGHGFSADNEADCEGFYLYDPLPGVPLRIISLDLGPHEGGSNGILAPPYRDGALDAERAGDPRYDQIAFLRAALADAEAEGVGVIVISHQASDAIVPQSQLQDLAGLLAPFPELVALIDRWSPVPVEPMDTFGLRELLAGSPAVIAHIAGHNHRNRVRAICPDGSERKDGEARCAAGPGGETGYWEVTTSAGIDYPHQARFFEVVYVGGGIGALYLTMLEPRIPAGSFAERARFIAVAHEQMKGGFGGIGDVGDRNVLLPFAVSEAIAARWAEVEPQPIASETVLREARPALLPLPVWP